MSSRQDQLHSYQYSLQRVVAALVTHDPDPSRSPFRRVGSTALVSLLVAVVALGGTAAYAAITHSGASKADKEGTLYIEKETGAQFVFYKPDGRLHPVLNYTSGLLIIGSSNATIDRVPRRTLTKATLGPEMGIPGAPNALPATRDLTAAAWAVCSERSGSSPQSLLTIGDVLTGGTDPGPRALIVQEPNGKIFLVYGNRKFMIPDLVFLSVSYFWSDPRPVQVAAAWINALPTGPDLAPLPIMKRGEPSGVPGARNGELFRVKDGTDGPSQWAVAVSDGTVVINGAQAKLLANVPGANTRTVTIAEFRALTSRRSLAGQTLADQKVAGHPAAVPTLLPVDQRLCLTVDPKDGRTTVLVDPAAPQAGNPVAAERSSVRKIDAVRVKPGAGVLVEAVPSPTAPPGSGTISIVTDSGRRFAIVDAAARAFLGYERATVQRLPAELVAVLPEGPALDPVQALKPLPAG